VLKKNSLIILNYNRSLHQDELVKNYWNISVRHCFNFRCSCPYIPSME
jgi:hypothetical protein